MIRTVTAVFAAEDKVLTWGERFSTGGIVALQGMATIFLVLALLWGAIELLHWALSLAERKKTARTEPAKEQTPVAPVAQEPEEEPEDDGAIVAAITAAISATLAESGYQGGFRVVSFKRAPGRKNRS